MIAKYIVLCKTNSVVSDHILRIGIQEPLFILQPIITTRIYVLHKITIALKFMSYINSDLQIPAKKLQTQG